jgi:hypothetical protein
MNLHPDIHVLDGPDFLDAVADAKEVLGNLINAAEYRRRARQWRKDQNTLERLQEPVTPPMKRLRRTNSAHMKPPIISTIPYQNALQRADNNSDQTTHIA